MLPLSLRTTCLLVLAVTGCGQAEQPSITTPARTIAIRATVCGALCDERVTPPLRAPGDFSGLACASEARIRLYPPGAATFGAAPLLERCVTLGSTRSLTDLFEVTAGLQGNTGPSTGAPVSLPAPMSLGPTIAEVALYAPGGEPCPADAPFLALGRSLVTDLAATAMNKVSVSLGCHASCATSQDRTLSPQVHLIDTGADALAAFDELTIGELFSYGSLLETAGVCAVPPETETSPLAFRSYLTKRTGATLSARYGLDTSSFGGCIALRGRRGGVSSYACVDGAGTTAPLGVFVPEAQRATLAALRSDPSDPPMRGTLLIQTVDATGMAVDNTSVVGPDKAPLNVGPGWDFNTFSPFTNFHGMAVFPDALPGEYVASPVGVGIRTTLFLGGAEPGTITTVRMRVQ